MNERIATLIAQVACDGAALPQGSPCSPVISDLIAQILDMRLVRLAKQHKVTYSRYADDITFSTSQKKFPSAIALEDSIESEKWIIGEALAKQIAAAGFCVNPEKTRMQFRGSRQTVTGLVVNDRVNISSEYFRGAKVMCHSLLRTGKYYTRMIPPKANQTEHKPDWIVNPKYLHGILSHIDNVKHRNQSHAPKGLSKLDATHNLFRNFLFYRHCIAGDRPLIIGEGKTDSIYLRYAIKRLPQFHPALGKYLEKKVGDVTKKEFQLAVGLFSFTKCSERIMGLGGSSKLGSIILDYHQRLPKIHHRPMTHPVILLLDNDDGLSGIASTIKQNFNVAISIDTTQPFYHLTDNLYAVKTPEEDGISNMESLFPTDWLKKNLNGKKFNPGNKYNKQNEYGKVDFAEKIVAKNASDIDFSKFIPLLERIQAVQSHYSTIK